MVNARSNCAFEEVADQPGRGEREHPGPDDSFHHRPPSPEALDRADAHDRGGNDVRGGKRNAVRAGDLNDDRGGRFRGEPVDRLQFHHLVTEGADDAPAARGSASRHGHRAKDHHPGRHLERRRVEESQARAADLIEGAARCSGEKREGDDAHGLLRVVRPVTVRHPGRADELQLPEDGMNDARREPAQR